MGRKWVTGGRDLYIGPADAVYCQKKHAAHGDRTRVVSQR